jgi:hypothetical protein
VKPAYQSRVITNSLRLPNRSASRPPAGAPIRIPDSHTASRASRASTETWKWSPSGPTALENICTSNESNSQPAPSANRIVVCSLLQPSRSSRAPTAWSAAAVKIIASTGLAQGDTLPSPGDAPGPHGPEPPA